MIYTLGLIEGKNSGGLGGVSWRARPDRAANAARAWRLAIAALIRP
jgi:hypothetical protein